MDLMFLSNRAEYGGQPAEMETNDVTHTTSQCKMLDDIMREYRESLTGFEEGPQISRGSKELENLWLVKGEIGAKGSWNGPSSTKFLPTPRDRGPMYSHQGA